ncbi:MAG: hypothetical protein H6Q70_1502 [Firmicutes bacterium]|nr:hypothetical protein [Bacillota bacterium]
MKSMTGFGRGEYLDNEYKFIVEIKSVNHRYSDIIIRMPQYLNSLEDKIRKYVSNKLSRGRIDIFISWEEYINRYKKIKVDKDLAIAYHNALRELSNELNLPTPNSVYDIAKYQDVICVEENVVANDLLWYKLEKALYLAVDRLLDMRIAEGKNIFNDLMNRINKLELFVDAIEQRAPEIINGYRQKILLRVSELLSSSAGVDESRLVQETALFAEKSNFTEEIIRLKSHILQFKETISIAEGGIGRKLDFIIQEMNRETNTIASKANDFIVANTVIDIKSEIEKIREQIQNIE